jgi:hypothetical protein
MACDYVKVYRQLIASSEAVESEAMGLRAAGGRHVKPARPYLE